MLRANGRSHMGACSWQGVGSRRKCCQGPPWSLGAAKGHAACWLGGRQRPRTPTATGPLSRLHQPWCCRVSPRAPHPHRTSAAMHHAPTAWCITKVIAAAAAAAVAVNLCRM